MRLVAGGLGFALEPAGALSEAERAALRRLDAGFDPDAAVPRDAAFRLELLPAPVHSSGGAEAVVDADASRVSVRHRLFQAEIEPRRGQGWLARPAELDFPLTLTLRAAMASRLPLLGGVPLHAAGVLIGQEAVVCFGPSGAGKSTLAGLSSHPLLSDELVAVVPGAGARYAAAGTGVWGTLGERPHPSGRFALRALVELDRAPRFALERLSPAAALRRLIVVAMVPAAPWLWSLTLHVLAGLATSVPCYRMGWSPAESPFQALDGSLPRSTPADRGRWGRPAARSRPLA